MNNQDELEIIKSIQEAVTQMKLDDYDEAPDLAEELFSCECCAQDKEMAGSVVYDGIRVCNDCVLLAEVGFALGKIQTIGDLLISMEDKKLQELCEYVKIEEKRQNN